MATLLTRHGHPQTVGHSLRVAAEAKRLARAYGVDESLAELAGWLHDISAAIPRDQRPWIAGQLGIEVLPEESAVPMILHQKLSAVIAREIFAVTNEPVLSAIGCHTTLKADASPLDKVVFVADKLQWDQVGDPPYLAALRAACEQSLDQAAYCYLDHLWQRRNTMPVVHPWFVEAYRQLKSKAAGFTGLTRFNL
jgi:predicted HD superfamily hydrolase involved in NAD metabolism